MGKSIVFTTLGLVLCVVGGLLMVLPGPGLLLVLAGVVVLSYEFTWAQRLVEPVRTRALQAAEASISSPIRVAASIMAGLGLIAAGIGWIVLPWLPLSGVPSGLGLIISGFVLLGLLAYTARRYGRLGLPRDEADRQEHSLTGR